MGNFAKDNKISPNPRSGWNCKSNRTKIVLHKSPLWRTRFMLRMGKMTDYATVVLASLAQEPPTHRAAAELAERTRLSRPTVSKVLKGLQRAGMVISSRGAQGGYRLARSPIRLPRRKFSMCSKGRSPSPNAAAPPANAASNGCAGSAALGSGSMRPFAAHWKTSPCISWPDWIPPACGSPIWRRKFA